MSTLTVRKSTGIPQALDKTMEVKFEYPGIPTTCDGAEAVVHVEIHVAQAAGAYPITSSTTMGGGFNAAVMNGQKNLWGDPLMFFEPESEHSAATVCEGFAVAGGRVTNFTSGQGLVLMKEVLYTISGKRLPVVMNIGARALTSQGLNVHAGHDDVMSVADCGWGMIFARNAQEAGDFCLICPPRRRGHPDAVLQRAGRLPHHAHRRDGPPARAGVHEGIHRRPEGEADQPDGPGQSADVRRGAEPGLVHEGQDRPALVLRPHRAGPGRVRSTQFYRKTGRQYDFVEPYRCEDADYILVGMGCYMETAKATVDYLREKKGIAAGCLTVFVFRPFPARQIVEALKNCKAFTVFERMDDPLSTTGNHLTREIKAAFCDAVTGQNGQEKIDRVPRIYSGAAGLGSRDVRPGDIIAAFHNMIKPTGQDFFCVGIDHPLALKRPEDPDLRPHGRLLDARPLGRRLRLGDDQQGHRHHRRQRLRQGRAGLSQVRLGEEGPADDLLPDHRRLAHHDAQRAGARRPAVHQRPDGHPQSARRSKGLRAGRGDLHAVAVHRPGRGLEAHSRSTTSRPSARRRSASTTATWSRSPARWPRRPTCRCACRASCCWAPSCELTPYARESEMTDEQVYAGVEKALRKYFGKRGDRVVQDNLNCVQARLQRDEGDSAGGDLPISLRPCVGGEEPDDMRLDQGGLACVCLLNVTFPA